MVKTGSKQYEYGAKFSRVVDGDTYEFLLDLGFDIWHRVHVRVVGASVVEMEGETLEEGARVANYVYDILKDAETLVVYTQQKRSFNRWLGYVFADGIDIGKHLVDMGMAKVTHVGWRE